MPVAFWKIVNAENLDYIGVHRYLGVEKSVLRYFACYVDVWTEIPYKSRLDGNFI